MYDIDYNAWWSFLVSVVGHQLPVTILLPLKLCTDALWYVLRMQLSFTLCVLVIGSLCVCSAMVMVSITPILRHHHHDAS